MSKEQEKQQTVRRTHHEKGIKEQYNDWTKKSGKQVWAVIYKTLSILICISIIATLTMVVLYLPGFGTSDTPANNEVAKKYITDGLQDTGAINIVAGVILDYRAFDTLGEATVLFAAAGSVLILLRRKKTEEELEREEKEEPKSDLIVQKTSMVLIPFIMIFGSYVVLNGHLSPGGGFSGGAIMGAGLILYYNAYGRKQMERFFTYRTFERIIFCSLAFYACAKSYSFYTGANHIHSIIPQGTPGNILSAGLILPLNICVGLVVACTMFGFYSLFHREAI